MTDVPWTGRLRCLAAAALVVAPTVSGRGESARFDALPAEKIDVAGVKPLKTEPVGIAPARPWVAPLGEPFPVDGGWRHVFTFKREGRTEPRCHPASLDLTTGRITVHPPIPGRETWKHLWLRGRLYLGQNAPGHLVCYDPTTDAFTDLGPAFKDSTIVFRMAETPDGKLALAGNHPAEISVFDPESGQFRRYGRVSETNGYCYELGVQGDHVYGATHGKAPWELVAIDRETGERTVLATRPASGYINLSGDRVGLRSGPSEPFEPWRVEGVSLVPATPQDSPRVSPPPSAPRPRVVHDAATAYEPDGLFTIHFQTSPDTTEWRRATLEVPLAGDAVLEAEPLADGRIVVAAGAYVPVAVFDPASGAGRQYPLGELSIRSALVRGERIYVTGYPSAAVHVLDPIRPLTSPVATPTGPAVAATDPAANPRLLVSFPMSDRSGGHVGVGLFPAPDSARGEGAGRIYLCTRRHRHHRGFSIAWFEPPADAAAEVRSGTLATGTAFDHLQVGGLAQSLDGSKLLVSTYVEPNDQLEGKPPAAARLFVIDLAVGAIAETFVPVADGDCLAGVAEVAPGVVLGLAFDADRKSTLVYRLDLATGRVTAVRRYAALLQCLPGTNGAPVKGAGFVRGPDGMAWTSMSVAAELSAVVRIDPDSLAVLPVGIDRTNGCALLFDRGQLYLAGAPRLRRAALPDTVAGEAR